MVNEGGINGTGKGIVNTNSKDFKGLQNAIIEHAKKQSPEDKIKYKLISLKLQMQTYISKEDVKEKIEVGEFLKRHLKAINIKNKQFANYIEIEESNLSSIINGRRKINIDTAFKLGQLFNINPNFWLLVQSKNELLEVRKNKYQKYKLKDLLKKVS